MAVLKLPDGRYAVHYRKGSNPDEPERSREYFGRGPEGKLAAENRNLELGFGNKKSRPRKRIPTFGDIAALYQEARMSRNTSSTNNARYYKLKSVILPELGHLPIDRLTHRRMDQYVNKRLKTPVTVLTGPKKKLKRKPLVDADGKPRLVKATTVHRELSDILAVLAWAVKNRKLAVNPLANYEKPRRDDARIRPPTPDEVRRLVKHAPDHLKRMITIAWYTGIRPGAEELLKLKWSDVDWDNKSIFVVAARKGGPDIRRIPLYKKVAAVLHKWYVADKKDDNRHIITYHNKPVTCMKTVWRNTKTAAGITRRLRPYDLRHAFVTYLLEGGADLKAVSAMAGHSRTETTTRVYQHLNMDMMRTTIEKMPEFADGSDITELYQQKTSVDDRK